MFLQYAYDVHFSLYISQEEISTLTTLKKQGGRRSRIIRLTAGAVVEFTGILVMEYWGRSDQVAFDGALLPVVVGVIVATVITMTFASSIQG